MKLEACLNRVSERALCVVDVINRATLDLADVRTRNPTNENNEMPLVT